MDSKLIHGPPHFVSSSNKNPSLISRYRKESAKNTNNFVYIISNILFLISPLPDNNSFLHKRTTYVKITTSIYQNCTLLNVP